MTDTRQPPRASRQPPYHPAEAASDANGPEQELALMLDGSLHHYVAPGTITHQMGEAHVPITTATSEGHAATSSQRNWGSRGAANEPGPHNRPGR
jgi:hypothetical protein